MPRSTKAAGSAVTSAATKPATTRAAKSPRSPESAARRSTKAPQSTKSTKAPKSAKAPKSTKAPKASKAPPKASKAPPKAAAAKSKATAKSKARSTGSRTIGDTDRFVEEQRKELLAQRDAYSRSANSLRAEADQLAQDREPGDVQFDEESGEGDSMNVERERDLALSAQATDSIHEIDQALARIEQGVYGVCARCGEAIPRERMKALPHAALCVKCKSGGLSRR